MTLKAKGSRDLAKRKILGARWDKLRTWSRLQEDIEAKLKEPDKFDDGITLDIGPQLLHTLRHRSSLRCLNHFSSKLGEIFTAHYNKGAVQRLSVWVLESKDRDGVCKHIGFETKYEITSMTFVYKHRVYLAFCKDLTLRVFTDSNSNFTEVHAVPRYSTILCLIYNREDDEVYVGGIGFLEEWRIQGAEHAASAVPGKKFVTELTRNEWIRDIKLDKKNNQMFALHDNGICVVNYKTRRQVHKLPNRHEGPLKCCCYYTPTDFLITGGADGKIKVFNGTAFNLIHIFIGHHGPVTGIEPHRMDSLLFSCSHDGTVKIWRLDSLQLIMRLNIGEKIYHLSLLGDTEFFFRTDKDVIIYTINQFYQTFASVESETHKLQCCRGADKPSRILGSTEDGSVRIFSPITGLTLGLIYPMPSFQVLSQFAYDIHQDRLHTVLTGGKVLVYNTSANPCLADEIWEPRREDEEVTSLLIVTVEFLVKDGTDLDNLIFAGLKNGQIILCEAIVCNLEQPMQAHIGSVTCLESCTQLKDDDHLTVNRWSRIILSGGTDNYVKLWIISVDTAKTRPLVLLNPLLKINLAAIPNHICMYSNILSVCIKADTEHGVRWTLLMYKLVSSQFMRSMVLPIQMSHTPDEDHSEELTALDKCPLMGIMLTAGKDGFVKVWSKKNELLREMNFATPIYSACFANDRGDIMAGYGIHICLVSPLNYLPLDNLRRICESGCCNYKDDAREVPVEFDHNVEPWLDLVNLTKYPIEIFERRKQKIKEEVIEKLKKASEKDKDACAKFVIFVDGNTTKVIRKEYADRLLNWARGKQKLKIGRNFDHGLTDETEEDEATIIEKIGKKIRFGKRVAGKTCADAGHKAEDKEEYLDSQKLLEIYPSAVGKAMRLLETQSHLGPHELRLLKERELLKRNPIIAPDGYIPNSVIRSKINIHKIEPPPPAKQWCPKPVPNTNPDHMPSWWGEEREKATPTPRFTQICWEDSMSPASSPGSPMQTEASTLSAISIVSLVEPPPKFKRECHIDSIPQLLRKLPTGQSKITFSTEMLKIQSLNGETPRVAEVKNKKSGWDDSSMLSLAKESMISLKSPIDDDPPDLSELVSLTPATPATPATPKITKDMPGAPPLTYKMRSRLIDLPMDILKADFIRQGKGKNGLKLTQLAVDEDSSEIHIKETKSGRRSLKSSLNSEIIQKLIVESWMPSMEVDYKFEDVLAKLLSVLDSNNPIIYESACKYTQEIFRVLGFGEKQLNEFLMKLGTNLNHVNTAIRKFTMKTLPVLGPTKLDVLLQVLPKLADDEEVIRRAAAEALQILTGAKDKASLMNILDEMGITSGVYKSRSNEKIALSELVERFSEMQEDADYFVRVLDWVEGTTPGMFDDDFKREEGDNWEDISRKSSFIQGKEASFVSDEKSVLEFLDSRGNTLYADLPATPNSSDLSDLGMSRGTGQYDLKSSGLKSENSRYNARMDLMDRAGASVIPSDRWQAPTPITPLPDHSPIQSAGEPSPFMIDPLVTLKLERSRTDLTQKTNNSFENMKLTERTMTDLSQVGPLPKFIGRDPSCRNIETISMDSAFESAFSTSDSRFSEKRTLSHMDQQSSMGSHMTDVDCNYAFDVERLSSLGSDDEVEGQPRSLSKTGDEVKAILDDDMDTKIETSPTEGQQSSRDTVTSMTKHSNRTGTGSSKRRRARDIEGFSTISDRSIGTQRSRLSHRDMLAYHPDDTPSSREVSEGINLESGLTPVSDPIFTQSSPLTDQIPDTETDKTSGTRPTPLPPNVSRATHLTVSEPRLASTNSDHDDSGMTVLSPLENQPEVSQSDEEPVYVRDVTTSANDTQPHSTTTEPTKSSNTTSLPSAELTSPSYTQADDETRPSLYSAILASSGDINDDVYRSAKSTDCTMSGSGSRPKTDQRSLYFSEETLSGVYQRDSGQRNVIELSMSGLNSPYEDIQLSPGAMSETGTLYHTMHRLRSSTELSMYGSDSKLDASQETVSSAELSLATSLVSPQQEMENKHPENQVGSIKDDESDQQLEIAPELSMSTKLSNELDTAQEIVNSADSALSALQIDDKFEKLPEHEQALCKTGTENVDHIEADRTDVTGVEHTNVLQRIDVHIPGHSAGADSEDDAIMEVNDTNMSKNSAVSISQKSTERNDRTFIINRDISDRKDTSMTVDDELILDKNIQHGPEEANTPRKSTDVLIHGNGDSVLNVENNVDLGMLSNALENGVENSPDVQMFDNDTTHGSGEVDDMKTNADTEIHGALANTVNGVHSNEDGAQVMAMSTRPGSVELDDQANMGSERDLDNGYDMSIQHLISENTGSTSAGVQSLDTDRDSKMSDRFTPKRGNFYKYFDKKGREFEDDGLGDDDASQTHRIRCDHITGDRTTSQLGVTGALVTEDDTKQPVAEHDSDYQSVTGKMRSQILERLSYQDSGFGRDMSEASHGRGHKAYPYAAPLSPVRSGSEASVPSPSTSHRDPKDWRKFFDLPNAVERRQMELIKREMAEGKLRQTSLPPISYFAEDLPMLPGEAGTRLLQTVRVGEKVHVPGDGRHRIESVPGKLGMHTRDEDAGMSNFGIIQMQWTTGIPTAKDAAQPPLRIPQQRSHRSRESHHRTHGKLENELNLPNLSATVSHRHSPSYAWELPLPPPPAKESRTVIPHIKREHDNYCKYYQLVKKKLHLYTSVAQYVTNIALAETLCRDLRTSPKETKRKKRAPSRGRGKKT